MLLKKNIEKQCNINRLRKLNYTNAVTTSFPLTLWFLDNFLRVFSVNETLLAQLARNPDEISKISRGSFVG